MIKMIRKLFSGKALDKENRLAADMIKLMNERKEHPLDWIFEGGPGHTSEHRNMVGEPVLTLLNSLKENPNRFKVYRLTLDEYISAQGGDIYSWMKGNLVNFYKFIDRQSEITHTCVTSDHKLYRIDGLPFNLNWWELDVLNRAFRKAREPSYERIRQRRIKRLKAEQELRKVTEDLKKAEYQWRLQ